jgi:hypothetical protein
MSDQPRARATVRVLVSDIEMRSSVLPFERLLAFYGIDTSCPYTQTHLPELHAHLYVQEAECRPQEDTP